jgi:hypothetical protein
MPIVPLDEQPSGRLALSVTYTWSPGGRVPLPPDRAPAWSLTARLPLPTIVHPKPERAPIPFVTVTGTLVVKGSVHTTVTAAFVLITMLWPLTETELFPLPSLQLVAVQLLSWLAGVSGGLPA